MHVDDIITGSYVAANSDCILFHYYKLWHHWGGGGKIRNKALSLTNA